MKRLLIAAFCGVLLLLTANFASARIGKQKLTSLSNRFGVPSQGLLAAYDFVQGADPQVLYDISGNGLHGQLGATAGADNTDPAWVAGGGLDFDGGDYVKLPQTDALDFADRPFSAVVRFTADTLGGALLSRGGNSYGGGWALFVPSISTCILGKQASGLNSFLVPCAVTPAAGIINTFGYSLQYSTSTAAITAGVYTGGSDNKGTPAITSTTGTSSGTTPYIGVRSSPLASFYDGRIYFVAIYERILTGTEHQNHHLNLARP
jgi:hypothetical protein